MASRFWLLYRKSQGRAVKFTRPLLFFAGSAGGCALRRSSSSSARRRARRSSLRRISSLSARAYRPCICFLKLLSLAEQAQTVQHMRTVRRWSNKVTSEDSIPHLSLSQAHSKPWCIYNPTPATSAIKFTVAPLQIFTLYIGKHAL